MRQEVCESFRDVFARLQRNDAATTEFHDKGRLLDKGAGVLSEVLCSNTRLQAMTLHVGRLSPSGAKRLVPFLSKSKSLKRLELRCVNGNRKWNIDVFDIFLRAASKNPNLVEVSLQSAYCIGETFTHFLRSTNVTKLCLSAVTYADDARVRELTNGMRSNKTIERLDISYPSSRMTKALLQGTGETLKHMSLRYTDEYDSFQDELANLCTLLESFNLIFKSTDSGNIRCLSNIFDSLRQNKGIRELVIEGGHDIRADSIPVDKIAAFLQSNTSLETLKLKGTKLSDTSLAIIIQALQEHAGESALKFLDISGNKMKPGGRCASRLQALLLKTPLEHLILNVDEQGVNKLAVAGSRKLNRGIMGARNLQSLDLTRCELKDRGVATIAKGMQANSSLVDLCLRRNKIGHQGIRAIAAMMRFNPTLRKLDLSYNTEMDGAGMEVLREVLSEPGVCNLSELSLRGCIRSAESMILLVRALEVNVVLRVLLLSNSGLLQIFFSGLSAMKGLRFLHILEDNFQFEFQFDISDFVTALRQNKSLYGVRFESRVADLKEKEEGTPWREIGTYTNRNRLRLLLEEPIVVPTSLHPHIIANVIQRQNGLSAVYDAIRRNQGGLPYVTGRSSLVEEPAETAAVESAIEDSKPSEIEMVKEDSNPAAIDNMDKRTRTHLGSKAEVLSLTTTTTTITATPLLQSQPEMIQPYVQVTPEMTPVPLPPTAAAVTVAVRLLPSISASAVAEALTLPTLEPELQQFLIQPQPKSSSSRTKRSFSDI